MSDAPQYRFYRHPRFSANQLAEYLCTTDAGQREGVIRRAKFPRRITVAAYQQAVPTMRSFFASNTGDLRLLDEPMKRLHAKADHEGGYGRDEALRCVTALHAFKKTYSKAKLGHITFMPGPQDVGFEVEGVTVNARLDPPVMENDSAATAYGGCVMILASTPESRKNIDERRRYVAGIAHLGLEHSASNLFVSANLCFSFDVFGETVVKAPTAHTRLRQKISAACRETRDNWDRVDSPSGYDGPDWR